MTRKPVPDKLARLATWSRWVPFADALGHAPRSPGVYLFRDSAGRIVYVGMAGERNGKGLRGRIAVYTSGKAAVSGLGEAALDRALADPEWLSERLAELNNGTVLTAKEWARAAAIDRAKLSVCWTEQADRASARALEDQVLALLRGDGNLWNKR